MRQPKEGDDLDHRRTGQRLCIRERFTYIGLLQPAAPLDKLALQKRKRCPEAPECDGADG